MPGKSYGTWQATVCVCVCVCVLVAHSCLTLCDPIDCRPPGSSVHGIYIYIYSCCCLVAKSCVILLQPHGLANPLDRGAWGAIVHETAKSWTQLNTHTHTHTHTHTSLIAQLVKNPPAMQETPVQFLGWEDPLEKQ